MKALKICLVTEPSGGGSGRHVIDLARGLSEAGHSVTIVWSPVRADPDWADELQAETTFHHTPVKMFRAVGPKDGLSLMALMRFIKRTGPYDIIHGHSSKAGALVRLLPGTLKGRRVYTPHALVTMDPNISKLKRRIYSGMEKVLSRPSGTIIAVSEAEKRHAQSLGLSGDIRKVVNGFRPVALKERSAARAQMGVSSDAFAVGFVGRLTYQKDPERFTRIISAAKEIAPHIEGVVIGDGEKMETLRQDDLGATRFLGWQDAAPLFPGLDLFLMTSRYEAMPYTLIEALAAGLPIVSTRVGGVEEAIEPGVNGQVFDLDADDRDIAEFIADLAANPSRHKRMAQASLQRSQAYTVDKMVENTLDLYLALTERGSETASSSKRFGRHPGYKV